MKKIFSKEVIIGLVTILSLFILYAGLNYLKGANIFKPTNHYYVKINKVSELQKSSPIYVNGFKVGLVNSIQYNYNDPDNLIVEVSLDKSMKVETGSYFELKSGLTSGGYLDLKLNKYVSSFYDIGDTLSGISEPGMMDKLSANLMPQIENLLPRLDSIMAGIQVLVNHPALSQSLDNIGATTAQLRQTTNNLNSLLANDIPSVVKNVNQITEDFTVISNDFKQLDLNGTLNTVDKALNNIDRIAERLNSKDNSLGLLLNDRTLYDNLDSTVVNASNLLLDLRQNPKRYVHFSVF